MQILAIELQLHDSSLAGNHVQTLQQYLGKLRNVIPVGFCCVWSDGDCEVVIVLDVPKFGNQSVFLRTASEKGLLRVDNRMIPVFIDVDDVVSVGVLLEVLPFFLVLPEGQGEFAIEVVLAESLDAFDVIESGSLGLKALQFEGVDFLVDRENHSVVEHVQVVHEEYRHLFLVLQVEPFLALPVCELQLHHLSRAV
jgi:hypothetical protein